MTLTSYEIQGEMVALPVHVRDADSWAAQFIVRDGPAQDIVDATGLEVAQPFPGRTIVNIAFVRYKDTDLYAYNELALAFLVRPHDARKATTAERVAEFWRGDIGVYIHQLPVTQGFTLEAGQRIWGYPKFLADIEITEERHRVSCSLACAGSYVLTIDVHEGGPVPIPTRDIPTYSLRDGILRRTAWAYDTRTKARFGGTSLELGSHPIADELRSLGLPKRAMMTSTMRGMKATFGAAEVV